MRTAAASEAWALRQVDMCSQKVPRTVTDCESLLSIAEGGARRATGPKQPLARIRGSIAAAMNQDLGLLCRDYKVKWVPALLGESAVGSSRPCGRIFSATDWRANRLADALAKNVSQQYALDDREAKLIQSAEHAVKHACALLGAVTHAANRFKTEEVGKDGKTRTVTKRESLDERRRRTRATPKRVAALPDPWENDELPDTDTTTSVLLQRACTGGVRTSTIDDERKTREALRRKQERVLELERTAALVADVSSSCKPCEVAQSAAARRHALLLRVQAKQTATASSTLGGSLKLLSRFGALCLGVLDCYFKCLCWACTASSAVARSDKKRLLIVR